MSFLPNRNLVLVVDDDAAMLNGVKRLLRQHDYETILFSSAKAFKNHTDFESAVCVILDINLNDGSGIELRHRLKADGIHAGYLRPNRTLPFMCCGGLRMHRVSVSILAHSLIESLKKASAST
jgi:CheY-like chemotaxis protein